MFTIFITFTQFCFTSDPKVVKFFKAVTKTKWNGKDSKEDRLLEEVKRKNSQDNSLTSIDTKQIVLVQREVSLRDRLTSYFSYASQLGVSDPGCEDIDDGGTDENKSPVKQKDGIRKVFSFAFQLGVADSGYSSASDDDL